MFTMASSKEDVPREVTSATDTTYYTRSRHKRKRPDLAEKSLSQTSRPPKRQQTDPTHQVPHPQTAEAIPQYVGQQFPQQSSFSPALPTPHISVPQQPTSRLRSRQAHLNIPPGQEWQSQHDLGQQNRSVRQIPEQSPKGSPIVEHPMSDVNIETGQKGTGHTSSQDNTIQTVATAQGKNITQC